MLIAIALLTAALNALACVILLMICRKRLASAIEYRRASDDYRTLVDHRLANPLTVIEGAAQTLLDGKLALCDDDRRALLSSIIEQAERMETLSLSPRISLGTEESCLRPRPNPPRVFGRAAARARA